MNNINSIILSIKTSLFIWLHCEVQQCLTLKFLHTQKIPPICLTCWNMTNLITCRGKLIGLAQFLLAMGNWATITLNANSTFQKVCTHFALLYFVLGLVLDDFDGLVQDCSIPNALAIEILQSCTKPYILPSFSLFHMHWGNMIDLVPVKQS